ncbi:hypothetical protein DRJ25_02140 [Candidatus Woesearchaeota archaeon]|nr:MAG: hypothetical protein DRJ25_02140 [Candidatus Woesearchaeota archaeon]
MKDKNNSGYLAFLFIFATIALAILVDPALNTTENATGSANIQFDEKPVRYAKTLEDWLNNFFHIEGIDFPEGACSDVAKDMVTRLIKQSPKTTENFRTFGEQKIGSLMFGFDQERIGVIEMVSGKDLLKKENVNSALNFWMEYAVWLPRLNRASQIEATLFGDSKDKFYVKEGRFSTPVMKCSFTALPDGTSDCSCEYGRHHDYANE